MPVNLVHSKHDEKLWAEAKAQVEKEYPDASEERHWALVNGIFTRMKKHVGGRAVKSFGLLRRGDQEIPVFWKSKVVDKNVEHGKLSESTKKQISYSGSPAREEMPADVFLLGKERKYPVKRKVDGKWVYSAKLLVAAARRARMQGRSDLAARADTIREGLISTEKSLWLKV